MEMTIRMVKKCGSYASQAIQLSAEIFVPSGSSALPMKVGTRCRASPSFNKQAAQMPQRGFRL
jgi:hypothetical protein